MHGVVRVCPLIDGIGVCRGMVPLSHYQSYFHQLQIWQWRRATSSPAYNELLIEQEHNLSCTLAGKKYCRDLCCQLARTDRFICKVLLLWSRPSIEAIAGTEREEALKDEQGVVYPFMAWVRNTVYLPLCLILKYYFAYSTTDKSLPK